VDNRIEVIGDIARDASGCNNIAGSGEISFAVYARNAISVGGVQAFRDPL